MDKIAHVIGGFGLAFILSSVLKDKLIRLLSTKSLDRIAIYVVVFGVVSFVIIIWEVLEFFILPFTYKDTIYDLICGLMGAFIWAVGHWSGGRWHLNRH